MNWLVAKFFAATVTIDTNVLPGTVGNAEELLKLILRIMIYGIGVAAVAGIVIVGILYLTARDNEAQAATAKRRLFEIAIGLVIWAAMWSILQLLVPGGITYP